MKVFPKTKLTDWKKHEAAVAPATSEYALGARMKNNRSKEDSKDGSTFEQIIEVLMAKPETHRLNLLDAVLESGLLVDPKAVPVDMQQWRKSNARSKRQRG